MHGVVDEWALINLASRADCSSKSIDLPLLEVAFEECIARVDLEAHAIGLKCIQANLAPELGAASALIEVHFHLPLGVHIIVGFVVLVVIKRPEYFVDVLHDLVGHVFHHIVIIGKGKLVAQLNDVAIESFPQIHANLLLCPLLVLHDHLGLGQVDVKVVETVFHRRDLLLQGLLLVIELDE